MPLNSSVPEVKTLMTGLMFGESPRWRDGRFWVSDWAAHEIIAVDLEGKSEVVVREPSIPLCFDFLPDGRMVIMSGRRIRRLEPDGSLAIHADLTSLCEFGWNEIVVDGRANAYVNAAGFELMAGADFVPGTVAVGTAVGCDNGDGPGNEIGAGHQLETCRVDICVGATVYDDLIPAKFAKTGQIGMDRQRSVWFEAPDTPTAHDNHASIRQEVEAQWNGGLANDDLTLALEID